jgi:hypothetical protein
MRDTDKLHDKIHAEGVKPPTPAQLEKFKRDFDAAFPSGAGCW